MSNHWKFETQAVHAGYSPDPVTKSMAVPIYQTVAYAFDSAQHGADLFDLKVPGNIYTRIMNPTQAVVEERIAALEGGVAALLTASGSAAVTLAILNIAEAGDHIVSSPSLYGGTYNLLHYTFPKLGIEVSFVDDPDSLDSWRAAVRPNTKAFFGETISNPKNDVLDIEGVAAVAHDAGVPLVVDNTVATPYLIRPIEWGADVVVHSATKYLGGHGTAIAGAIVDSGKFDFGASGRHPNFTEPDPSYHGLAFSGLPEPLWPARYILKARLTYMRDLGAAIAPFNAFVRRDELQAKAAAQSRANLALFADSHAASADALRSNWKLADAELELRAVTNSAAIELRSPRIFLDAPSVRAALASMAIHRLRATLPAARQIPSATTAPALIAPAAYATGQASFDGAEWLWSTVAVS